MLKIFTPRTSVMELLALFEINVSEVRFISIDEYKLLYENIFHHFIE